MVKNILNDYRCSVRQGLKNVRDSGEIYGILYSLIIVDANWVSGANDFKRSLYCYIVNFIFLITFLLSEMYPNKLSKMLQLCPLTNSEKEQYLKQAYIIKTIFPVLMYMLVLPFFVISRTYSAVVYIITLVIIASCAVSVNIYRLPIISDRNGYNKKYEARSEMPLSSGFFRFLAIFSAIIGIAAIYDFSQYNGKISGTGHIICMAVIVAANVLICIKMLISYYNIMIKFALNEYKR